MSEEKELKSNLLKHMKYNIFALVNGAYVECLMN